MKGIIISLDISVTINDSMVCNEKYPMFENKATKAVDSDSIAYY